MILSALTEKLKEQGGVALYDHEWANSGTVSFVPDGSLTPHATLGFRFDGPNWYFFPMPGGSHNAVGSWHSTHIGKKYAEDELAKVVDYLVA